MHQECWATLAVFAGVNRFRPYAACLNYHIRRHRYVSQFQLIFLLFSFLQTKNQRKKQKSFFAFSSFWWSFSFGVAEIHWPQPYEWVHILQLNRVRFSVKWSICERERKQQNRHRIVCTTQFDMWGRPFSGKMKFNLKLRRSRSKSRRIRKTNEIIIETHFPFSIAI